MNEPQLVESPDGTIASKATKKPKLEAEEIEALLPEKYRPLVRRNACASQKDVETLAIQLDVVDGPGVTDKDWFNAVKLICHKSLFHSIAGNADEFFMDVLNQPKDQVGNLKAAVFGDGKMPASLRIKPEDAAEREADDAPTGKEGRVKPQPKTTKSKEKGRITKRIAGKKPGNPKPTESATSTSPGDQSVEKREFRLDDIVNSNDLLGRFEVDEAVVKSYADLMRDGVKFPPIDVFEFEGKPHNVSGGHRFAAARMVSRESMECLVHQGTRKDALRFALSANAEHGHRLTNKDKRKNAETALREFPEMGPREMSRMLGVTHPFISNVKKELDHKAEGSSKSKTERNQDAGHETNDEQREGDSTGNDEANSDDTGASQQTDQEPKRFNHKTRWKSLKEQLLNELELWPEEHLPWLGDRLGRFANKFCPNKEAEEEGEEAATQ